MSSPLVSTWSSGDGLSLTATRVEVELAGKESSPPLSPVEKAALEDGLTCREEVHAHLKAAGGRLLGSEEKNTASAQNPSLEIWVWDTTLFMEVRYVPATHEQRVPFHISGTVHAFVNEGWGAHEIINQKRFDAELEHVTHTPQGHRLVYYRAILQTLPCLLEGLAWIRRFSDPVEGDDLMHLESSPFVRLMACVDIQRESDTIDLTLDTYLERLLSHNAHAPHWKRRGGEGGPQDLYQHCVVDATLRQHLLKLPDDVLCESRRLYEQWFLWINGTHPTLPPPLPESSWGPMVALPSLLVAPCAQTRVHAHRKKLLQQVLDHMTPEETRRWWCTPDALGKTGAQWFLSGVLGSVVPLAEKQFLQTLKQKAPRSSVENRVRWGKTFLQRIERVIGPQEKAWTSEQWTPTGLALEAISTSPTSRASVPAVFQCLELLPEAAQVQPTRCLTFQPFPQKTSHTQLKRLQNTTLNVSVVQCALAFTFATPHETLMSLFVPRISGLRLKHVWDTLLIDLALKNSEEGFSCEGPFDCDGRLDFFNDASDFKDSPEQYNALAYFLELGARLQARIALTQTLEPLQAHKDTGKHRRRV